MEYDIFENEAFNCISDEQKNVLKLLSKQIKGKSPTEAMPLIMMFMSSMPQGKQLTSDEQSAIMKVFIDTMPTEDQEKFNLLLKIAKLNL